MDKKKIGCFLKELRQEKKLTQEQMVEEYSTFLGLIEAITTATISKWERGESFPDMSNLKDLAKFFNVSVDEIFNGEREKTEDYKKKYFIYNNDWLTKNATEDKAIDLWELRNRQELEVEQKFNELLGKLVKNTLNVSEEKEFDFICSHFYALKDKVSLEEGKFRIRKECALMHKSSYNEKLWEAYKFFKYDRKLKFYYDICDAVLTDKTIIAERIKNTNDLEKDILLAFVQKNNFSDPHGQRSKEQFFKVYGIDYDVEKLTKEIIRVLIENGANLNDCLLGYYSKGRAKRNVLDILEKGYNQYKKPILISVRNNGKHSYYLIENTKKNRKLSYYDYQCIFDIDENILDELEQKLYNGERDFIDEWESWNGIEKIKDEEFGENEETLLELSEEHIEHIISNLSYQEYVKHKDEEKTKALLNDLDVLPLKEIREKYFTREEQNYE